VEGDATMGIFNNPLTQKGEESAIAEIGDAYLDAQAKTAIFSVEELDAPFSCGCVDDQITGEISSEKENRSQSGEAVPGELRWGSIPIENFTRRFVPDHPIVDHTIGSGPRMPGRDSSGDFPFPFIPYLSNGILLEMDEVIAGRNGFEKFHSGSENLKKNSSP
jgi:hypothetical protein